MKYLYTIILMLIIFNFFSVIDCQAVNFPSLVPPECRGKALLTDCIDCKANVSEKDRMSGEKPCCCNLSSVETMVFNAAQIIMGVAGSVALAVFVYSGFLYILGGSSTAQLSKAKDGMKKAIIGLFIIFAAGVIMKMAITAVAG